MRRDYFIFGGIDSRDYGLLVAGPETADAPERDVTYIDVPGRSGALLVDNGRFKNKTHPYHCSIIHDFERRFEAFKTAMLSRVGYHRLEDTIHPEQFRLASFKGPIRPQTTPYNLAGEFDIEFDCKPQRYLKSGERAIQLAATGGRIINPGFPALPLVTVYGSGAGTLSVDGGTVVFKETFSGPIILDCDIQNAYYGDVNKNAEIFAPVFPVLPTGESVITWDGGVERVEIIPRWWTV